jgi:hypothetical protein
VHQECTTVTQRRRPSKRSAKPRQVFVLRVESFKHDGQCRYVAHVRRPRVALPDSFEQQHRLAHCSGGGGVLFGGFLIGSGLAFPSSLVSSCPACCNWLMSFVAGFEHCQQLFEQVYEALPSDDEKHAWRTVDPLTRTCWKALSILATGTEENHESTIRNDSFMDRNSSR